MKKITIKVLLTFFLAFGLTANALAGEAMDRILQRGELIVGTSGNQVPFTATTTTGGLIGMDIDLAKLIAANMGLKVKFEKMPFAELLPSLQAGKIDLVLSGVTMTLKRNLKVAFVGPYYISGKAVLTKTQTIANIQSPDNLNKPEITFAALRNSTSKDFVDNVAPKAKLVVTDSLNDAVKLLLNDKVDALVSDYPFSAVTAYRYPDRNLKASQVPLNFEPLAIAVQDDALLINWLQNFIEYMKATKELERLQKFWLANASWLRDVAH